MEKLIPGTKNFTITDNGIVKDSSGKVKNEYKNKDGYRTVAVLTTNGKWVTFGIHRLLALTYIPLPSNKKPEELQVNHIDKQLSNCDLSNLEWVTVEENNIHSALYKGTKNRPSILITDENGNNTFVDNILKASKIFKCEYSVIWECIKNNTSLKGFKITYLKSNYRKPPELHKTFLVKGKVCGRVESRKVKVLNISTQEVNHFNSLLDCCKYFKTNISHIHQTITRDERIRIFRKQYLIVYEENNFPIINEYEYEKLTMFGAKEVLAYNAINNSIYIYKTAISFIKENGLSKKAITTDLKNNRLRMINGWWYTYKTTENIERFKSILSLSRTYIDQAKRK